MKTIEMRGITYPLTVSIENMDILLQDETGEIVNTELKSGEDITIYNKSVNKLIILSGEVYTPKVYSLKQNYPNPFNPTTSISFSIPSFAFTSLKVYDILGNEVATLVNEEKQAGTYEVRFDASNLSSGVYLYRLQAKDFTELKKMILLR
jgi:hypothetical protein